MSLYKIDTIIQELVHYLKNIKIKLWKKFQENYSNRIKKITFYKYL